MVHALDKTGFTIFYEHNRFNKNHRHQSLYSLDTPGDHRDLKTGTGDHENYFAGLDLAEYLVTYNGSTLNTSQCQTKAVKIRVVSEGISWPNIPDTTLLFSNKTTYYSKNALDSNGDIQSYNFHKTVKPHYG